MGPCAPRLRELGKRDAKMSTLPISFLWRECGVPEGTFSKIAKQQNVIKEGVKEHGRLKWNMERTTTVGCGVS